MAYIIYIKVAFFLFICSLQNNNKLRRWYQLLKSKILRFDIIIHYNNNIVIK